MDNELRNEEVEELVLEAQSQELHSSQNEQDGTRDATNEPNDVQKQKHKPIFNRSIASHAIRDTRPISKAECCIMFLIVVFAIVIFGISTRNATTRNTNDLIAQIEEMKLQITKLNTEIIQLEEDLSAHTNNSDDEQINISISLDGKDYVYNPDTDKWEEKDPPNDLPNDPDFDTRPFLGVAFNEGNDGSDNPIGLKVDHVYQYSPAEFAGMKAGDIIMSINGTKINVWSDLEAVMATVKAEETIQVEIATIVNGAIEFKTVNATLTYRGNFDFSNAPESE
jgi:membrane-associated protease RseP (regulator of RpoE activity)